MVAAGLRTQTAAPGHRAGRGSQQPDGGRRSVDAEGCARPPRRARIATARWWPPVCGRRRLRPATAPGEDRNVGIEVLARVAFRALRPATAPGEDRNAGSDLDKAVADGLGLRPATAPGEDRNGHGPRHRGRRTAAAPGHRAGRGSQHDRRARRERRDPGSCARPPRRARIATIILRSNARTIRHSCARPPRRARIATASGLVHASSGDASLRPATAPGEDRNSCAASRSVSCSTCCARPPRRARIATPGSARRIRASSSGLRPATGPGEDRNLLVVAHAAPLIILLRPATAPGEDRNSEPPTQRLKVRHAAPGHRAGRGSQQ